MATSTESAGHLTQRQIVRLAAAISADAMESIAEGYMDVSPETVKNIRRDASNSAVFNKQVIRDWVNRNAGPSQVRVRNFLSCHYFSATV